LPHGQGAPRKRLRWPPPPPLPHIRAMTTARAPRPAPDGVLCGTRVVSLALNLPGPAALMRLADMGATCLKMEPPARDGAPGDPMAVYAPAADEAMHRGIARHVLDLKSDQVRHALYTLLQEADVLVTLFRPSALSRLGVHAEALGRSFPGLSSVHRAAGICGA